MLIKSWLASVINSLSQAFRIRPNRISRRKRASRIRSLRRLLAAAALTPLLVASASGDGNCDGTFAAQVTYPAGAGPFSVATGDFNGDGVTDLVTANSNSGNVSVLLGVGDGTFADQATYPAGDYPPSVTTGDFNGDGFTDLAIANDNVSVLLGVGDGTFAAQVTFAAGDNPLSVATGDFNGDGVTDLVTANSNSGNVSVLLGVGDGTFADQATFAVGHAPFSVTTGDFNGDGVTDLATANAGSNNVSVLLGVGDGTFAAQATYAAGDNPRSVTTGEFNGDGVTDLATAHYYSDNVSVLLGVGDGTFADQATYTTGDYPNSVTTGDFNGDGFTDLATANPGSGNVSVLLGVGDGTFAEQATYAAGDRLGPFSVTTGDFNGDGFTDLATANYFYDNVSVLLNQCGVVEVDSYTVTRGEYVSGGIPELAASDNLDLSLWRLTSDSQSRTEFTVKAVSPTASPSSFAVTLEGAVFARSTVNQTIELWDYVAGVWEQIDTRAATRFTDSTVTVSATSDLSRFVEADTMCIEARIRYQSPVARQRFSSNTDQFIWRIGQ